MKPPIPIQKIPTGLLLEEYRETLLTLGSDRGSVALKRRADVLEEEINRRIAW